MVRAKACAARQILVDIKDTKRHVFGVHIRPLTRKDTKRHAPNRPAWTANIPFRVFSCLFFVPFLVSFLVSFRVFSCLFASFRVFSCLFVSFGAPSGVHLRVLCSCLFVSFSCVFSCVFSCLFVSLCCYYLCLQGSLSLSLVLFFFFTSMTGCRCGLQHTETYTQSCTCLTLFLQTPHGLRQ